MFKVVMNDSSSYALSAAPYEDVFDVKGVQHRVLCIPLGEKIDTLKEVKEIFSNNPLKTAEMRFYQDGLELRAETNYTELVNITTASITINEEGEEVRTADILIVKMMKGSTIPEQLETLTIAMEKVQKDASAQASDITKINETISKTSVDVEAAKEDISSIKEELAPPDTSKMDLAQYKTFQIVESKSNLAAYLASHPITSDCHGDKPAQYSITAEKQQLLVAMIMMAQTNPDYQPSWNATGEECTYDWTVEELIQLAGEIEATVRPLVSKQQTMEARIDAAKSKEDVDQVNITF